jgi:ribosomal protein L28
VAGLLLVGGLLVAGPAGGTGAPGSGYGYGPGYGGGNGRTGPAVHNPCHGKLGRLLRCPNLRIGPPHDLYVTRGGGKVLLHSTTDIKSRGEGPMEIRGKRTGRKTMSVRQVIHTRRGGRRSYRTNAHLVFWYIPYQGPYWKLHLAARFELWSLGPRGGRRHLVRVGPKLNYCLRDLERTKPSRKSPRNAVYPGCSQDPGARHRTLGTSVGWSDIYPTDYYQNWINVRGLRGCFAFVLRADPKNLLYENREDDNTRGRHIRLPIHGRIHGCRR